MRDPNLLCVGGFLLPLGLFLLGWSIRVWQKPSAIRSISFMYQYFLRWYAWLPGNSEPTEKHIKLYAACGIILGALGVLGGLLVIFFST